MTRIESNRCERKIALMMVLIGSLAAFSAEAQLNSPHREINAGNTLSTAEIVASNQALEVDSITGTFSSPSDVDLYCFALEFELAVDIDALGGQSGIDTCLLLFDQFGRGMAGDDDGGTGVEAQISVFLPKGVYYLAVAAHGAEGLQAFDSDNNLILDDDDGDLVTRTTRSMSRLDNGGGGDVGDYAIRFSQQLSEGSFPSTTGGKKKSRKAQFRKFRFSSPRDKTSVFYESESVRNWPGPMFHTLRVSGGRKVRHKAILLGNQKKNLTADLRLRYTDMYLSGERKFFLVRIKKKSRNLRQVRASLSVSGMLRTTSTGKGRIRFLP